MNMKKILFAMLALCGFSFEATAQETDITTMENVVYIDPAAAETGETVALPVKMKNAVEAEGFQFNLTLPGGMTFVTENDGEPVPTVTLSSQRGLSAFNLFSSVRQNNSLTVVAGSVSGQAALGNDGEVCTVMVRVATDMAAGDYELVMRNIAISDSEARSHNTPSVTSLISINDQTAIRNVNSDRADNPSLYNLQGQRLPNSKLSNSKLSNSKLSNSKLPKGLYIKNGQKVIIGD